MAPARITDLVAKGDIPVTIVGVGHIGLPLALLLTENGARVFGCDKDPAFLEQLRSGLSPIVEHGKNLFPSSRILRQTCPNCGVNILVAGGESFCPSCMKKAELRGGSVTLTTRTHQARTSGEGAEEMDRLLKKALRSGRLTLTTDTTGAVRESSFAVITVGTPIDEKKRPESAALVSASRSVGKGLKKGDVVIVRSTVSPGTTENLVGPILTEESGLIPGKDFGLAHVPETTIEGLALFELKTLPKMVGGVDGRSAAAAAALFGIFKTPVKVFDDPTTTETAKLFLNIYRDVNIALANELALASEAVGVDVMKVIEATRSDPKTNILTPGPGVGGFCLTKDSYYLTHPASEKGFVPRLVTLAREVNDAMPSHVCVLTSSGFEEARIKLKGSRIAVLGVAFKGNTSDSRESPSLSVIGELLDTGAEVVAHDPLVKDDDPRFLGLRVERAKTVRDALKDSVAAVILTDHLEYRKLTGDSMKRMGRSLRVVVDARHLLDPSEARSAGLVYRGVGHGEQT